MGLLENMASGGGRRRIGTGNSFTKQASLFTLTIQNSMLSLVMHYSRVMPPSGDHRYFTSTAVFLTELIKLAVSLTLAMYDSSKTLAPNTPATVLFEQIHNAVFSTDGWKLALPAAFYTFQNMLQYVAVGNLDAVHFQVLYELKIIITAVFSVCLLHRPLGPKRWLSLILLTLGVIIVSLPPSSKSSPTSYDSLFFHSLTDHFFPRSMHELGQDTSELTANAHLSRRSATYEGIDDDLAAVEPVMNYSLGLAAVLVAAAVSGLTGVYFEKLLKESPTQATLWIRNIQLSFYSAISALIGGVFWQDGSGIREHGFFEGYNWIVWTAIVLQASGGLIGSLVIRDAGNIVKNFAMSISIVVSFVVSVFLFDFPVTLTFLFGTSLVLFSTYLYSATDRIAHRPPPIKIASFEKPMIESVFTPGATTPRSGELRKMTLDPMDARGRGLGLSTSRPNSPMLPRQPSRGNWRDV